MRKATMSIMLCCLCCISLLSCGEVENDGFIGSSSGVENSHSSSSYSSSSSESDISTNPGTYDIGIVWKIPAENSVVHGSTKVHVDRYVISEKLITQEQYLAVMGENPSKNKNDNLPVEEVNWFKAIAFCEKLSELMGLSSNAVRLPTEAEWEIAAYEQVAVIQRNYDYWEWTNDCFDSLFPWEENNPSGPPNCSSANDRVRKGLNGKFEDRYSTDPYSSNISGGYISFRVVIQNKYLPQ